MGSIFTAMDKWSIISPVDQKLVSISLWMVKFLPMALKFVCLLIFALLEYKSYCFRICLRNCDIRPMLLSTSNAANLSYLNFCLFPRYTPYFFDKNMLDKILEESVDQHFHSLIKTRHSNRRRDIADDNMASEVFEENAESIWEPPEVQN